jgi:hypothetical protein
MGVTKTYYEETLDRGGVDASFGASGLFEDAHPRNLQRLWLEYGDLNAAERVRVEYVDYAVMRLTDRGTVQRWG